MLNKISATTSLLESHNISSWTTPLETTRRKLPSEWTQFYVEHPLMDFKLATDKSLFLVVQVPDINDKEQIALYSDLIKLPFLNFMANGLYKLSPQCNG